MNVHAPLGQPVPVKLTIDDFLLLRRSGAFADFSKSELIEGELLGVRIQAEDEPESDAIVPIKLRVQDYLRLAKADAFRTCGKTELLDGVVYEVNPQFRPHMVAKSELAYRIRRALETVNHDAFVGIEGSVHLSDTDAPLPDIVVTNDPRGHGPVPAASILLIVEVADSSLAFDLSSKAALYAGAGIAEYWVIDVNARLIHQLWGPDDEVYAERRQVAFGERVEAATIEALAVETGGL